ncbi:MAG: hypothetical protein KAI81_02195, partial [Candidatus Marinimicrobia bacterium]|nr:hypothetical protein [Candidatus Neomarinimicrobiota bacterium]
MTDSDKKEKTVKQETKKVKKTVLRAKSKAKGTDNTKSAQANKSTSKDSSGKKDNRKQDGSSMSDGLENFDWKKASKTPMIWVFLIVSVIIMANMMASTNVGEREITFTQFQEYVDNGLVLKGEVIGAQFHGMLKESQITILAGKEYEFNKFVMTLPFVDNEMIARWDEKNIQYTFKQPTTNWTDVLINFIPWILILGLWIFWMRRLQGGGPGGKGIFSFGKSPAKMLNPDMP